MKVVRTPKLDDASTGRDLIRQKIPYCYLFWRDLLVFAILRDQGKNALAKINNAKFNTLLYDLLIDVLLCQEGRKQVLLG